MIRLLLVILFTASAVWAQTPPSNEELNRISNDINKLMNDPATHAQGLKQIEQLWNFDRQRAANGLRHTWLKALQANKRHAEVEKWSRLGVLALPNDQGAIETILTMRVRSLLALGEHEKAIPVAKSYFNVCSLGASGNAMLLLAECLSAAQPPTPATTQATTRPLSRVDQFRLEQTAGATFDGKRPLTETGKRSPVLDSIRIDASEYDEEIRKQTGEDYSTLLVRGNLLLLADRANDAMSVFERAYAQASDGQLQQASEAIARCMRAQDGTIGRANAWVISIRPPKKQP